MRTLHQHTRFFCTSFVLFFIFSTSFCYSGKDPYVPKQLQSWVEWVLHDKEEQLSCVFQYNNSNTYHCSWPSELEVQIDNRGGNFSQLWLVHNESRIKLPGSLKQWPYDVKVNDKDVVVTEKKGVPTVELQEGTHRVTGSFMWPELPEYLQAPTQSGIVTLIVNGKQIEFPDLDASGRLWLRKTKTEEKIENRLKIESFRLIDDGIPAQVTLHFTLDVAGSARELTLGPLYDVEKLIPISLDSRLPARIEQDGRIKLQVRPGRYTLVLKMRHEVPLHELSFYNPEDGFWPAQEIWAFKSQPNLRLVEVEGGVSVDPTLTSAPNYFHKLPAYRMVAGDILKFNEIKRGDPQPAPDQLHLTRNIWLRFDGSGYTIQDNINGKKNTNWRLEMNPAIELGRVEVDGKECFITRQKDSEKAGVELRNGLVNVSGDSLYKGDISTLPATGWDHDFQEVKGSLFLPPGWKLLNTTGIDNISRTWIKKWTLLDIFIVLIFTLAAVKVFSLPLAAIAFFTMVLTYHEPGAPCYVWLALLLGIALLKHIPDGRFKNVVKVYHGLTLLVLLCIAIPYGIESLRIGIYPQLARPWTSMAENNWSGQVTTDTAPAPRAVSKVLMQESYDLPEELDGEVKRRKDRFMTPQIQKEKSSYYTAQVMQFDPKTNNQTGPGLPKWSAFETVPFSWSGPVTKDQTITFFLIGPKTNLALAFVRLFLVIVLGLGMLGLRYTPKKGFVLTSKRTFFGASFLLLTVLPYSGQCSEMPTPALLEELQQRLLEKDECYPSCASIPDLSVKIDSETLALKARVDAQVDSVVPMPSHVKHWMPKEILLDGVAAKGVLRKKNVLWLMIPAGKHLVQLSGPIRKQNTLQLPFSLKPHRLSVTADGWVVEGIHPDGSFDTQLQFKRKIVEQVKQGEILETGILPSFVQIERTLLLGLVWKVQTRVHRLSPTGSAVVADIPLLTGESVTTPGVRVENGVAKINLRSDQRYLYWESFLEPADNILLEHAETNMWTEIWKVDVSSIYHMEYEGIPVILHKTGNRWYPTWHPWPGEKVVLKLSRPLGVDGQTMTIEDSHLDLRPGRRTTGATLQLTIKSSQGGRHTVKLPELATLQEVKIKGKVQPIRQEGREVVLPITPGNQSVELKWLEARGMTMQYQSSEIDLGVPSVNAGVDIHLPGNRWPLFIGGEQLVGPAVLFWSVVFMVILVAFGLAKSGLTPLRFHQWFLLGIGMSMSNLAAALIVVAWLIGLEYRSKANELADRRFNLVQIGIVFLTVAAMFSLVFAISAGLLGHPDMNIIGNGSSGNFLRWYHDVSEPILPRGWVFSIPMLAYRIAMLTWALWLSFWLVTTLKWGWKQFTTPQICYSRSAGPRKKAKEE